MHKEEDYLKSHICDLLDITMEAHKPQTLQDLTEEVGEHLFQLSLLDAGSYSAMWKLFHSHKVELATNYLHGRGFHVADSGLLQKGVFSKLPFLK